MSTALSALTLARIAELFAPSDREHAAVQLLERSTSLASAFANEQMMERVHLAAIKCSEGSLVKLQAAIDLMNADWRDLLVAANFAHDVDAHLRWSPT
ncbi:MAG: hypothetical protein AAGF12_16765 [Myxococcota bacterium]